MEHLEDHNREPALLAVSRGSSLYRCIWEQHALGVEAQLREPDLCRRNGESCSADVSRLWPRTALMDGGLFLDRPERRSRGEPRPGFRCLANQERYSSRFFESATKSAREPRRRPCPVFRGWPDCAESLPSLCQSVLPTENSACPVQKSRALVLRETRAVCLDGRATRSADEKIRDARWIPG